MIFGKMRLHSTRSNANRRLATFANGRLRHLLKIGQSLNNNFVLVSSATAREVCDQLKSFASCPLRQILAVSRRFASSVNASESTWASLKFGSFLISSSAAAIELKTFISLQNYPNIPQYHAKFHKTT